MIAFAENIGYLLSVTIVVMHCHLCDIIVYNRAEDLSFVEMTSSLRRARLRASRKATKAYAVVARLPADWDFTPA